MNRPQQKEKTPKSAPRQALNPEKKSRIPVLSALGAVLLLTVFSYRNGMNAPILPFDDNEYFMAYPEILNLSWNSVLQYFSGYYVLMYQPLPILSFALQYHFTGTEVMPLHALNLIFHLLNVVLVFMLVRLLLKKDWPALLVAALFALHPLGVEAVTWISARSSGMYTAFYLLSLICWVRFREHKHLKFYLLSLLCFLLSLFSKAQAVTLPVLLLTLDLYLGKGKERNTWLNKIPFFLLSVTFGLIAVLNEGTAGNITEGMMVSYKALDMVFLWIYSYVFYLIKFVAPFNLSAIYVYPPLQNGHLPWEYYGSVVLFALTAWAVWQLARRNRFYLLAFAFFFFTISLNIQVIPSRLFIVADRYTYFPYLGLFLMLAWALFEDQGLRKPRFSALRTGIFSMMGVYLIVFVVQIRERNTLWSDGLAFMSHIIEHNPEVPYISRAYGNRANLYLQQGRMEEAGKDFTQAIRIQPEDAKSWFNRGVVYANMNQFETAIRDYDSALVRNPEFDLSYSRRAIANFNTGNNEQALKDCDQALAINPQLAEAWNTRGAVNFVLRKPAEASSDMDKAIALIANNPEYYRNRGVIRYDLGRKEEACADWQIAIDLGDKQSAEYYQMNCLKTP